MLVRVVLARLLGRPQSRRAVRRGRAARVEQADTGQRDDLGIAHARPVVHRRRRPRGRGRREAARRRQGHPARARRRCERGRDGQARRAEREGGQDGPRGEERRRRTRPPAQGHEQAVAQRDAVGPKVRAVDSFLSLSSSPPGPAGTVASNGPSKWLSTRDLLPILPLRLRLPQPS